MIDEKKIDTKNNIEKEKVNNNIKLDLIILSLERSINMKKAFRILYDWFIVQNNNSITIKKMMELIAFNAFRPYYNDLLNQLSRIGLLNIITIKKPFMYISNLDKTQWEYIYNQIYSSK